MLSASSIAISVSWFAYVYCRANRVDVGSIRAAALFGAALSLTVSPWALRNKAAIGAPVFLRSNLGLELALSNHDAAAATDVQTRISDLAPLTARVYTRISILALARSQYTPALPRIPRLSALNPAHHLRRQAPKPVRPLTDVDGAG